MARLQTLQFAILKRGRARETMQLPFLIKILTLRVCGEVLKSLLQCQNPSLQIEDSQKSVPRIFSFKSQVKLFQNHGQY